MGDSESEFEREEEQAAAAEAAGIGGRATDNPTELEEELSEAERPLYEAGEGDAEGFELAEAELEEHAAHGDEHSAGRIIEDAALLDDDEDDRAARGGEADEARPADE